MKEINQIIHLTNSKDVLKSILQNGFYTSYAKETFGTKNILIPMISFANILFRDIGENEVVNYGKYGIVFNREIAIEKFDLNPVFYIKGKSNLENTFINNFENSIIPQTLHVFKNLYKNSNVERLTDKIYLNPLSKEISNLLNSLDKNVNDDFLESLKLLFEGYFINSLKHILLLKPFKVKNKEGIDKIAYNEREWRKSFVDLNFISEFKPNGKPNEEYNKWITKTKPHYKEKNILPIEITDIQGIYVYKKNEIEDINKFIQENFGPHKIEINTLTKFKSKEKKT